MERACFVCGAPIAECMGYVLARDILPVLEAFDNGHKYTGRQPRELCAKSTCNDLWKAYLAIEDFHLRLWRWLKGAFK